MPGNRLRTAGDRALEAVQPRPSARLYHASAKVLSSATALANSESASPSRHELSARTPYW